MDLDDQETILHNFISSGIAKMLRMHHAHRACWYHIQHIPGSSRNLSSYIVMLMEFGLVREGRRIHLILHTISAWETEANRVRAVIITNKRFIGNSSKAKGKVSRRKYLGLGGSRVSEYGC